MNIIKHNSTSFVSAKELYDLLGIKKQFSQWIKYSIKRAYLEENKDFLTKLLESTGGRPITDYWLTKDSAIVITIMSGGKLAQQLRDKLIELFKKHESGLAFTSDQIIALMEISKSMCLISIQKEVERKHFDLYNQPETWYQYRAGLLGYSTQTLKDAMIRINKKYKNQRTSLIKLDANELIRTGVIDLMKVLGKSDETAQNIGNLCKEMAQKMDLGLKIWDDTKSNPLGINNEVKTYANGLNNGINRLS